MVQGVSLKLNTLIPRLGKMRSKVCQASVIPLPNGICAFLRGVLSGACSGCVQQCMVSDLMASEMNWLFFAKLVASSGDIVPFFGRSCTCAVKRCMRPVSVLTVKDEASKVMMTPWMSNGDAGR